MKNIERIISKIDNLSDDEIKDIVQKKSEYGTYIFEFNGQAQKDYYKYCLNKYNLYDGDHTVSDNYGVFFYSPRILKRKNDSGFLPGYAIYSAQPDFVSSGKFGDVYYTDDVNLNIIKHDGFNMWLENYLVDIFGIDVKQLYSPKKFIYDNINVMKYSEFLNENKIPKLSIDIDRLINTLGGNNINIFRKFRINKDAVEVTADLETLYTNSGFNDNIEKNKLKKGKLQNTLYNETLLDDKYTLKFFFLYDEKSIELEEPKFIILQYINTNNNKKSEILGYTNTDSINDFYEKLTDATIELSKGDNTYIYQTSNGGNNWEMKNVQMEDETMKGTLDRKELQKLINKNNFEVKDAKVQ